MNRWARTGTIVAGIAMASFAIAQGPDTPAASADSAGVRGGEILVVRSAGQPVRRLKVVNVSTIPGGPTLVDVEDTESSARYTIPLQALGMAKREPTDTSPVLAAAPTPPPTPTPSALPVATSPSAPAELPPTLPPAKAVAVRPGPRLHQPFPRPMPGAVPPRADSRQASAVPSPAKNRTWSTPAALARTPISPAVSAKVRASVPPTAPNRTTQAAATASPTTVSAGLPRQFQRHPLAAATPGGGWPRMTAPTNQAWPQRTTWNAMPNGATTAVVATPATEEHPLAAWHKASAKPVPAAPTEPRANPVLARAEPLPTTDEPVPLPSDLIRKLKFDPSPASTKAAIAPARLPVTSPDPMPASATAPLSPPPLVAMNPPAATAQPSVNTHPSTSASAAALAARDTPVPEDVRQASLSAPARNEVWAATPMDARMTAEVGPWMHELKTALRPSVRETAASALVNGRYASRPAIKAALAAAAMADPAASVRAHCVRLLSRLGYHDADYVTYLRSAAGTESTEVQAAARLALVQLTPR